MITTNFNKKTGHKLLQGIVDEVGEFCEVENVRCEM